MSGSSRRWMSTKMVASPWRRSRPSCREPGDRFRSNDLPFRILREEYLRGSYVCQVEPLSKSSLLRVPETPPGGNLPYVPHTGGVSFGEWHAARPGHRAFNLSQSRRWRLKPLGIEYASRLSLRPRRVSASPRADPPRACLGSRRRTPREPGTTRCTAAGTRRGGPEDCRCCRGAR